MTVPGRSDDPRKTNHASPKEEGTSTTGTRSSEEGSPSLPLRTRKALERLARLLAGFGLMVAGFLVIENASPSLPAYLDDLNAIYRFDIPILQEVLAAVPLLAVGLAVLLRAAEASPFRPQTGEQARKAAPDRFTPPAPSRRWFLIGIVGIGLVNLQLSAIGYQAHVTWLFLASLAALLYGHIVWDREHGCPPTIAIARADAFIVLGLMLLGLLILTYRLADIPSVLIGDEAAFFSHAKRLAEGASDPHPFGFSTYSFPALATYVQAGTLRLFGTTVWAWRFASVLPSILAIPALYWLAIELSDRRTAIGACVLFICLPFTLSYSRLGYNVSQVFPVLAAGAAALVLAEREGSRTWAFAAGAVAGLGSLTYLSSRIIPLAALSYFGVKGLLDRTRRRRLWLLGGLFLLAVLLTMSPHLIFGAISDRPGLGSKLSESLLSNGHYVLSLQEPGAMAGISTVEFNGFKHVIDLGLWGRLTIRGIVRTLVALVDGSLVHQHFLIGPIAGAPTYLFVIIGLGALARRKLRSPLHFLSIWLVLGLLALSALNTFPPRPAHLSGILPLLPLFAAAGVTLLIVAIRDCLPRLGRLGATALFGATVLGLGAAGLRGYFVEMPRKYPPDIESAMTWSGMAYPHRTVVYLHTLDIQATQVPFLFDAVPIEVPYVNAYVAEQGGLLEEFPTAGDIAVFARPSDAEVARRQIGEHWEAPPFSDVINDPAGKPLVHVYKNGDFPTFPERSFFENIAFSYWQTPVRWVIATLPLVSLLVAFGPRLLRRSRRGLLRLLIWLTEAEPER